MRVCLVSLTYPPQSSEGIPRQRQILAHELVRLGHQVSVVTLGEHPGIRWDGPVPVYECSPIPHHYTDCSEQVNHLLGCSQALYEGIKRASQTEPFDIIDVPLWLGQGLVPILYLKPVVVWIQTTTAQLVRLRGSPATHAERFILGFEQLCLNLASGILSDSSVALQKVAEDYRLPGDQVVSTAMLGLPALAQTPEPRRCKHCVEALVIGRLERRKGTDLLLFEILPQVLRQRPRLRVRLIGSDNSRYDGWSQKYGKTYAETFRQRYPALADRVIFEGYVSESVLEQAYAQADLVLVPSRYESFGIVYLEAMRAALPIITFDSGSVSEIFPEGEAHGAVIVPDGDTRAFAAELIRLVDQPSERAAIGQRGYQRLNEQFTAAHMVKATLDHYRAVLESQSTALKTAREVYQVMEALDVGDAVSRIACDHARRMRQLGQPADILARFAHDKVRHMTAPLHTALTREKVGLIFHYWHYNSSAWLISIVRGPKAIYYHNITPPEFFSPGSLSYISTSNGYQQIGKMISEFDLIIGVSQYNITELARFVKKPTPSIVIYPAIDLKGQEYDKELYHRLSEKNEVNIVFVGRIAPNKRQDRLIQLFDYYYRFINRYSHLWLIGNNQGYEEYINRLMQMKMQSIAADRIHFTGKVSEAELHSYYKSATVFVCASDHEGFCVPIVEAMSYGVPVLAYAAAAVPETMGDSGILVYDWNVVRVAEMMNLVIRDRELREKVVASQYRNLQRFTDEQAYQRLQAVISFLCEGRLEESIQFIYPQNRQEE